jgi:hypothetical protein
MVRRRDVLELPHVSHFQYFVESEWQLPLLLVELGQLVLQRLVRPQLQQLLQIIQPLQQQRLSFPSFWQILSILV